MQVEDESAFQGGGQMATKAKKPQAQAISTAVPAAVVGQGNPGIGGINTANLMGALAGLKATSAPSGKKPSDPNVFVDAAEVDNYVQAMKDEKDAKARKESSFELLQPELEAQRVALSRQFGKHLNSLDVNHKLKFIVPCKYLSIEAVDDKGLPTKVVADLQAAFGGHYGKYFQSGVEIKVKASTFETLSQDQQVRLVAGLTALCQSIGANPFEIKATVVPTEALDVERVMDPAIAAIFDGVSKAKLCCPIKSTLKELGK